MLFLKFSPISGIRGCSWRYQCFRWSFKLTWALSNHLCMILSLFFISFPFWIFKDYSILWWHNSPTQLACLLWIDGASSAISETVTFVTVLRGAGEHHGLPGTVDSWLITVDCHCFYYGLLLFSCFPQPPEPPCCLMAEWCIYASVN